jgi:hypothetical protein
MNFKEIAEGAQGLIGQGAPKLGERVAEAARKAGESTGSELIDTRGLRDSFGKVAQSIRDTMPKPEDAAKTVAASGKVTGTAPSAAKPATSTLAPIVTSLGKVGGGGYSAGALDAQRENNRLTTETNRILQESNRHIKQLGYRESAAAFG